MPTESIGQILLRRTSLTAEQLDLALRLQQVRRPAASLGHILIEKGFVSPEQLCRALAEQWRLPTLEVITPDQLHVELIRRLPLDFLKKHSLLPILDDRGRTVIALADPLDLQAYDALAAVLHQAYPRALASFSQIDNAISRCFYARDPAAPAPDPNTVETLAHPDADPAAPRAQEDLLNIANQAPIVKLVNTILFEAVSRRASDIHVEPYENELRVRFRIDGILHDACTPPRPQAPALISRLKIMANLDIAERRLPQDGQSRVKIGQKELDVRVSTIPTAHGERVVLRLLDRGGPGLSLEQLGFDPDVHDQFRRLIHCPHGILLLTGPTGSGKTTTLYCAINELNDHQRNILTVEDPIEYHLPGVGQTQVKPKINLTFAHCLRHLLRQDPDVIMIGEIRDRETAEIAIHASLTGHLVLSTLHTNDAPSAVTRLTDMGIEPYLLASSLIGVMAQRLVRSICPRCKTPCAAETPLPDFLPDAPAVPPPAHSFFVGAGCDECLHTGYLGRTGIFELLVVDDEIKELIAQRTVAHAILNAARRRGMKTLRDDGLRQALAGATTLEEILRVTQDAANPAARTEDHARV